MSALLAQYAQQIQQTGANAQQAMSSNIKMLQDHREASARDIVGLQESLRHSDKIKLERERLASENENAIRQSEDNNKFMQVLAIADQKGADGKPIGTAKAFEIVNGQIDQARAQRAQNMPQNLSTSDLLIKGAAGTVAAIPAGFTYLKQKGTDIATNYQANKTNKGFIQQQAQAQGLDKSTQKGLLKGYTQLKKIDKQNGTNYASEMMNDIYQDTQAKQNAEQKRFSNYLNTVKQPIDTNKLISQYAPKSAYNFSQPVNQSPILK